MRAEAPARFGKPEIFNTDQGSQFTSAAFTGRLATGRDQDLHGRARTMGGNVFIERLWRSLKDEDVDLKGYADGREARAGIGTWIAFDNRRHAPGAVIAKGRTTHDAIKRRAFVNWSFNEKVALATGAASGIGLAAARAFAEVGAAVALADVQENAVRSAAEELVLAGPRRSQPPFSGFAAPAQAS